MRLPRWLRRPTAPVPSGRHSRALGGAVVPVVPGAAASLVATAATAGLETVTEVDVPPAPTPTSVGAPVTLGFADGASVELADDDPRVRTFRAAAAALLEAPAR